MINQKNIIKYLIMFFVVTMATKVIPTCGVLQEHAIYVGLIAASTFALIDICIPHIIREKE
jgi:exosortase/archaeosortase